MKSVVIYQIEVPKYLFTAIKEELHFSFCDQNEVVVECFQLEEASNKPTVVSVKITGNGLVSTQKHAIQIFKVFAVLELLVKEGDKIEFLEFEFKDDPVVYTDGVRFSYDQVFN